MKKQPPRPPDMIVCLDLATTFGWASYNATESVVRSGYKKLDGKSHGSLYDKLHQWLSNELCCLSDRVTHVYCEQPFARGAGTRLLMGYLAIVEFVCYEKGVTFKGTVTPQSIKSFVAKGGCGKDDVITAVKKLFPDQVVTDDNQSDALALLAYVRKQ